MDGVLLLDKPQGLSSNAALQRARMLLRAEKAGHTGTLDPEATGLLPLCFGQATRFSSFLLEAPKGYQAWLRLGETSTTGDAEGERSPGTGPLPGSRAAVQGVLEGLLGEQEQVPPMHSALKHGGRPLYDYARAGVEVARPVRRITILALDLLEFQGDRLVVQVTCSKGTYVRVLAEEIGRRLGCGAWLAGLRRTSTGGFSLRDALTLESLSAMDEAARLDSLLAPECLVQELPCLVLGPEQALALVQGRMPELRDAVCLQEPSTPQQVPESPGAAGGVPPALGQPPVDVAVRAYDPSGRFLGLVRRNAQDRLQAVRLMAEPAK